MATTTPPPPPPPPDDAPRFTIRRKPGSAFRFDYVIEWIDRDGRRRTADCYLTYEISHAATGRTTLLVNWLELELPWRCEEFTRLAAMLRIASVRLGNIGAAKQFVNELLRGTRTGYAAVTHRFGPVPAYALPGRFNLPVSGFPESGTGVQVMFYPITPGMMARKAYQRGIRANKREFIECINWRLDVLFTRYLEDVAARFHAIQHFPQPRSILRMGKDVEWRIAESIKTKLDAIAADPGAKPEPGLEEALQYIRERHASVIETTRMARDFALFALNELYRVIGVKREAKYERRLATAGSSQSPEIAAMLEAHRAFANREPVIAPGASVPDWCVTMIEFLRFVSRLRTFVQERLGRYRFLESLVLVSDGPSTDTGVRDFILQTRDATRSAWPKLVMLPVGADASERCAGVWLSYSLWGFFDGEPGAADAPALAARSTAALATQYGRSVHFVVRKFATGGAHLLDVIDPENPPEAERVRTIAESLGGSGPQPASKMVDDVRGIDNLTGNILSAVATDQRERFVAHLLSYLDSLGLDRTDRRALRTLWNQTDGVPLTKDEIGWLLNPGNPDGGATQFAILRGKCYRRTMIVMGQEYRVFDRPNNRRSYRCRLQDFWRKDFSGAEDLQWIHHQIWSWLSALDK